MRYLLIGLLFFVAGAQAQTGTIKGKIYNKLNKEPVPFAPIIIDGTTKATNSDENGKFEFNNLNPGIYNLKATYVGFKPVTVFEVEVKNAMATFVNIEMEESVQQLTEAVVEVQPFVKKDESPLSMRTLGEAEIKRNPGANRDISKVIQSLPGVAATASFRNDIIVRGGSPNENRFYLDGIEVPNINHFATQGASGGPVGMLNVDFIESLDFYSGAFPANRGNALSSVLDFRFKDARTDKALYRFTFGASDLGITVETPLSKKSTIIASWRRSYLQFLFKALELPFLPTYDDFQFKTTFNLDEKNIIDVIGLGAIDKSVLNTEANKTETQQYILNYLPEYGQWNYTIGMRYRHFNKHGFSTWVVSRNMLNNNSYKYPGNDQSHQKTLDYNSTEAENKLRFENTQSHNGWRTNYGANFEYAHYTTETFQQLPNNITLNYNSEIGMVKYGVFGNVSHAFINERLMVSAGVRFDGNDFNNTLQNPLNQFSPRISASYNITPKLSFNANTGIYNQLPPYTVLGFRDSSNHLVNSNARYINSTHFVAGFEYVTTRNSRVSIEGFYKLYANYPFDLIDSISLANKGTDFGVIGNTPVSCDNKGRAYGLEVLVQQKLHKNFYGLLSYTFMRSEFQNFQKNYVVSSWDYRHIFTATAGVLMKRNWEVGAKLRFTTGNPYTPYNVEESMYKPNWDVTGQGIPDYNLLNTQRNSRFYQLDIRIDKKYNFKKWSLNLYVDIQNVTNSKTPLQPYLSVQRDANGVAISNPANAAYYMPSEIADESGTIIPTVGIIIEF